MAETLIGRNCYDIVAGFNARLTRQGQAGEVRFLGGLIAEALGHPDLTVDFNNQLLAMPGGKLELSQFRDREMTNRRDADILVMSTDEDEINEIEAIAKEEIGDALEVSVFGLHDIAQMEAQTQHPFKSLVDVLVSERYVEQQGGELTEVQKSLFPFAVEVENPAEAYQPWWIQLGNADPMCMEHPALVVGSYETRSPGGGPRPKDLPKVRALVANLADKEPRIIEELTASDGIAHSHMVLAGILRTMGKPASRRTPLRLGRDVTIEPLDIGKLPEHPAFMLPDASPALKQAVMRLTIAKSRATHIGDNQERIVAEWQKHVVPRIQGRLQMKKAD